MSLERSAFIERFKFAYINISERSEYSFKRLDDFFVVFFRKSLKIFSRSIFFFRRGNFNFLSSLISLFKRKAISNSKSVMLT